MQIKSTFSLRDGDLDLASVRQRCQERLSLRDLRHFRRSRKAFEGRHEDSVGVGGADGRLVEVGESECGAQFEAACGLLPRDGNGSPKCFLRKRGAGGIALEQHFATDAIEFGFECARAGPLDCRQRFIEDRNSAVDIPARASA